MGFSRSTRIWCGLALIVTLGVIGAALSRAAHVVSDLRATIWVQPTGAAQAHRLQLTGAQVTAFARQWDAEVAGRAASLQELSLALSGLGAGNTKRGLDRIQAAAQALLDNYVQSVARLGRELTPGQQARLVGGGSLYRIARMPGMKQAMPALLAYLGECALKAVAPEVAPKLSGLCAAKLAKAAGLICARADLKAGLDAAAAAGRPALLAQLSRNHLEMAEVLAESLRELRSDISDADAARVLSGLARGFGAALAAR